MAESLNSNVFDIKREDQMRLNMEFKIPQSLKLEHEEEVLYPASILVGEYLKLKRIE